MWLYFPQLWSKSLSFRSVLVTARFGKQWFFTPLVLGIEWYSAMEYAHVLPRELREPCFCFIAAIQRLRAWDEVEKRTSFACHASSVELVDRLRCAMSLVIIIRRLEAGRRWDLIHAHPDYLSCEQRDTDLEATGIYRGASQSTSW